MSDERAERGGVLIAWNLDVMKKEHKEGQAAQYGQDATAEEVEATRGRVARVKLVRGEPTSDVRPCLL